MKNKVISKVTLGKTTRWTYVNAWEPTSFTGTPKYSVRFVIPKTDTNTMNRVHEAISSVYEDKLAQDIRFDCLKLPYFDGDLSNKPEFKNAYVLLAASLRAPKIVDTDNNIITKHSEIHSGVYGRAKVAFYTYNKDTAAGVACELLALQKFKDGESTASRPSAFDDFSDIGDE